MTGRILFLIPARGGSRRVPRKNLRRVAGIPLVGHAIRTARLAARAIGGGPHAIVCSTDEPEIAAVAMAWGATVLERPADLATDDATSVDVALHALDALDRSGRLFDSLILLQPTSPLTDSRDVVDGLKSHRSGGGRSVVAVTTTHPVGWHEDLGVGEILVDRTATRSGELANGLDVVPSGAFYIVTPDRLRTKRSFVESGETVGQVIPRERSIDVDEEPDLLIAEALAAGRHIRGLDIEGRSIASGRTFVIAEAGVNHNGDLERALDLVDAAAATGADAVKFQTFDPVALAAPAAPVAAYQALRGVDAADQRQMLDGLTLPLASWPELQARARAGGLVFLSTPFDDGSADMLDGLGVPAFKVGSGDLTNLPYLARLARRGRPLLVSTGMADMIEVAAAVDLISASGDPPLALLHCVSAYPADPEDANLRAIETMRRAFGVPVGWSDHTTGTETSLVAVALGAAIVEKHLTLDRTLPGPDHAASLDPASFKAMVAGIRAIEAALGDGTKVPALSEAAIARVSRRSLHWSSALEAGAIVREGDLATLRPGTGIPPGQIMRIIGRPTRRRVEAGEMVRLDDVVAERLA